MTVILQARMSSSRLPGKTMALVEGKPLLGYVVERIWRSRRLSRLILATSDDGSDDAISDYARTLDLDCFRGPLLDVAGRFRSIVLRFHLDEFARLCADSPLMDAAVLDAAIDEFYAIRPDLLTNIFPRSFPKGQSVEIFRSESFLRGYSKMSQAHEREHVTPFFYNHADEFNIINMKNPAGDFSAVQMCVDEPADLEAFRRFVAANPEGCLAMGWMDAYKTKAFGTVPSENMQQ